MSERLRVRRAGLYAAVMLLGLAAVIAIPAAGAAGGQPAGSGLYFVELSSPPAADGTSLGTVRGEQAAFRDTAKKAGLKLEERHAYGTLFNGFSIEATDAERAAIGHMNGVKAVWPVLSVPMPDGDEANPELANAIQMTGADIAQNELGLTGAGVRVAVMDTGIDYDHSALGGSGTDVDPNSDDGVLPAGGNFPNSRVVAGFDFVGNSYNNSSSSTSYQPTPHPDNDPDDCQGHGTHVSGIVGANGAVKGVAPGVSFGAYRVFGCDGSTSSDIMLAAMERALADHMDILNMSIGSAFMTWPQYPTAAGADRLVRSGMVVVASIGNSGADGVWSAGAPGVGRKVIGVASVDNTKLLVRSFTISPDNKPIGFLVGGGSAPVPTTGSLPMARTGTKTTPDDACNPLPAGSLTGMAALIRRGTCNFVVKEANALNAGAAAVVLYNNQDTGLITPAAIPDLPVVFITRADGELINDRLATGPVTLTWSDQLTETPNPTAGQASSFTSYGLTAELDLKPDVSAPGGFIRSTYPLEKGGFATISGTSMASPHTAGAAALILEARPHTSPDEVRTLLQNSADPYRWTGSPAFLEPVHRQGAGLIDIDDTILSTTTVEPGKLALGESEAGPQTRTLTVTNASASPVTYNLSNVNGLGTGGTFGPITAANLFLNWPTVTFSQAGAPITSITVPAGGSASFEATFAPDTEPDDANTVYGGWIVLTGGGKTYRVPFAGYLGDYQAIRILDAGAAGIFPTIGRRTGVLSATDLTSVHTPVAAGAVFTMVGDSDKPYVLAHFAHQVRKVRIELFNAATNKRVGLALTDEYRERNSRRTGTTNDANSDVYMPFLLDGTVKHGNGTVTVPNGSYYAVLSVEKALGDDGNPAHWETWTSNPFSIARP
jgi:minor extracellular serine protease Vpr